MRLPRFLYKRFDAKAGHIPWWAFLIWPRLHFCRELDELLCGDEQPKDLPFLCRCVSWPDKFYVADAATREFYDHFGRPPF